MIELTHVAKVLDKKTIIDDISLTLKEGQIIGFIGRNGSGKSILFKMICGFIYPTSGTITIDNVPIQKNKDQLFDMRALIEKPNFIGSMSGFDNLLLLAEIQKKIGKKEIEEYFRLFDLWEDKDKKYSKYSLGMKQKLGIIQTLMENPKYIILDEPFNGVEDATALKIRDVLLEEKKRGKTILIATHIKDDIEKLCDKVYRIDGGKIVS